MVKIDKAFVDHLTEDETSPKLIATTNSLAEVYGAATCVEGVETERQLDIVRSCGVDLIQGYYFSKPLSLEDFVRTYS